MSLRHERLPSSGGLNVTERLVETVSEIIPAFRLLICGAALGHKTHFDIRAGFENGIFSNHVV